MSHTHNGKFETASGDLLSAGYCDFTNDGSFNGAIHFERTDCPHPAKVRGQEDETLMTRFIDDEYVEVAQP